MPPATPMVTDAPARSTLEDLLDAPKYFYTAQILQTTPQRESIREYLQDFLFVLAGSLDAGAQDDITEDLSYLSGLAADAELVFDVGIPEPLAFWVPAAPITFTALDDTKITVKMTKADTVTGREGHSTDNRWGQILQPRKDGTHFTEMAADAAEALATVGITITPASIKEMRNKITKASRFRIMFKFTYDRYFHKMVNELRDHKTFMVKKTRNHASIILSKSFCAEMEVCARCFGFRTCGRSCGAGGSSSGIKRQAPTVSASSYRARLLAKQAKK